MFVDDANQAVLENFINEWQVDDLGTREAFVGLVHLLGQNSHSLLSFHPRPGITCSLRGHVAVAPGQEGPLYAMIDVIDDDPRQRWLSVCFYGERITDPDGRGDMVPGGLLGQDALCFDYDGDNPPLLAYIGCRLAESYQASLALTGVKA